jgi:hypothetical protein
VQPGRKPVLDGPEKAEEKPMYPLKLVHDLRPELPWSIYSLPIYIEQGSAPALHERRFAVKWDEDNDVRVLAAVLDAYFHRQETVWNLFAVGERKGLLTVWALVASDEDIATWQAASDGPAIMDSWPVEVIDGMAEIARTGGLKGMANRTEGHVTRAFPPEHDQLNWLIKLYGLGPSSPRREW